MKNNVTFEEIEKHPDNAKLIEILKKNHGGTIPDEVKKYLLKRQVPWTDIIVLQRKNWVKDLIRLCKSVNSSNYPISDLGLFWIKFEGLKELKRHYNTGLFPPEKAPVHCAIGDTLNQLLNGISESENAVIDHQRQAQCHPSPTGHLYDIEQKKDGTYKEKNKYKKIDKDDFEKLLHEEYSKVDHPEVIARRIISKSQAQLEKIHSLMEKNEFEY